MKKTVMLLVSSLMFGASASAIADSNRWNNHHDYKDRYEQRYDRKEYNIKQDRDKVASHPGFLKTDSRNNVHHFQHQRIKSDPFAVQDKEKRRKLASIFREFHAKNTYPLGR